MNVQCTNNEAGYYVAKVQNQLLETVGKYPGITLQQLEAKLTRYSKASIKNNVRLLRMDGVLNVDRDGFITIAPIED